MPKIIKSIFTKTNMIGDFKWMMVQAQYKKTLFIYNDDVESRYKYTKGKGNAIIRQYNRYNPNITFPRVAGIPTGSRINGGFLKLDNESRKYIDDAIYNISKLLEKYEFDTIMYAVTKDGNLDTGIYKVDKEVISYITKKISLLRSITYG